MPIPGGCTGFAPKPPPNREAVDVAAVPNPPKPPKPPVVVIVDVGAAAELVPKPPNKDD